MVWDDLDAQKEPDETSALAEAATRLKRYRSLSPEIQNLAERLVVAARVQPKNLGDIVGSFLRAMDLASEEGRALMQICETLDRTSDTREQLTLLREQLARGDWDKLSDIPGLGKALSFAAHSLKKTGKGIVGATVDRAVLEGVKQSIGAMSGQFVLGETVESAISRAERTSYLGSFDMLGEGARTDADADRYEAAYAHGIAIVARRARGAPETVHGISVKLSALDPRYSATQQARVNERLFPRLERLMHQAAAANIGFCIDAEECDRLVASLQLLDRLEEAAPQGWTGLGLAVQAYQRRSVAVIDRLAAFARERNRRLMIRLVKGAYWDYEIKHAQLHGRADYPVFTRKSGTDIAFLACAEAMLDAGDAIFPSFATHNAHTLAAVHILARERATPFEFQRLHGMGDELYAAAEKELGPGVRPRIYAPVGKHSDLLPYLVRRLLENGANSSFVRLLRDTSIPPARAVQDPLLALSTSSAAPPRGLPTPPQIYGAQRPNSGGMDLSLASDRARIAAAIARLDSNPPLAQPLVAGLRTGGGAEQDVRSPADTARLVGRVRWADEAAIDAAFIAARGSQDAWNDAGGAKRAQVLRRMADALQANMPALIALIAREAGRTLPDGISEVREAIDFCRYYAALAEDPAQGFNGDVELTGPTGEKNTLASRGRGVFACISPWNFPLAIFTGQITAALAAGNTVIAKPAEQTPLIACLAVTLFREAGLPEEVLSLLPGDGSIGARLVGDPRHDGVAFTGGTETARAISGALRQRTGPLTPFIAETGGMNGMFVDSTALPEQVTDDVLVSAFGSAGQRCSSTRFLFVPEARLDAMLEQIHGALEALRVGDPALPETDIGPLIDGDAVKAVEAHLASMNASNVWRSRIPPPDRGFFVNPAVCLIGSLAPFAREVFGPVLHVMPYPKGEAAAVAAALRSKGFALTLGIHTRLDAFQRDIRKALPAGNVYVNRPMIGAVVGVQPFGGFGLSGSGSKAGGVNTLRPFAVEQSVSINEVASGGNLALLNYNGDA